MKFRKLVSRGLLARRKGPRVEKDPATTPLRVGNQKPNFFLLQVPKSGPWLELVVNGTEHRNSNLRRVT